MKRFMAAIEYHGAAYSGWQSQPFFMANGQRPATVQMAVEEALSQVAARAIEVICSGRTDAGVHALQQIIHFDSEVTRRNDAWLMGANRYLPPDVRVIWLKEALPDFHARYSALGRRYCYLLRDQAQASALWHQRCYVHRKRLNHHLMHEAAQYLLGEHDFSAFRSSECQAKSPKRFLKAITVQRRGEWLMVTVEGNAFLHHMVRNIVGSLLMIGDGRRESAWLAEVLQRRDRRLAGATAPAAGLYFCGALYPAAHQVPLPRSIFPE